MPAADGSGPRRSLDDPAFYSNQTCGPASFLSSMAVGEQPDSAPGDPEARAAAAPGCTAAPATADGLQQQLVQDGEARATQGGAAQPPAAAAQQHQQATHPTLKRIRTDSHGGGTDMAGSLTPHGPPLSPHGVLLPGLSPRFGGFGAQHPAAAGGSTAGGVNPVDHIFQFHKALRQVLQTGQNICKRPQITRLQRSTHQHPTSVIMSALAHRRRSPSTAPPNAPCPARRRELREIEATAVAFQVATEEATSWEFDAVSIRGTPKVGNQSCMYSCVLGISSAGWCGWGWDGAMGTGKRGRDPMVRVGRWQGGAGRPSVGMVPRPAGGRFPGAPLSGLAGCTWGHSPSERRASLPAAQP